MEKLKPVLAWLLLLFIVPIFTAFFVVFACCLMGLFELVILLNPKIRTKVNKLVDELFDPNNIKPTDWSGH
jgi:hypothetical protein